MGEWASIYWIAPITAWLIAQIAKIAVAGVSGKSRGSRPTLISSGNMPSSHSAITVSLLVVVAAINGLHSAEFGIAFVLTSIAIYDALNVRRAVGEQGEVLKNLTKGQQFYTAIGHRPSEVIAGSVVGIAVALILLQIL